MTCIRYLRVNNIDKTDSHFVYADKKMIYEMYEQHRKVKLIVDSMDNDRVEVFYQPIFQHMNIFYQCRSVSKGFVMSRENCSTIRICRDSRKNGLIIQLGEMVFRKVCQF